jgi:hypothetical protein
MRLHISDFRHSLGKDDSFGFGVDRALTAASLRKLADAIDAREIIPQGAEVSGIAEADNFTMTKLRLTFAEKICETTP